jgi:hypothetical protein
MPVPRADRRCMSEPAEALKKRTMKFALDACALIRQLEYEEPTVRKQLEKPTRALGWLEFIDAAGMLRSKELNRLIDESRQLVAIMSASYGTARENQRRKKKRTERKE